MRKIIFISIVSSIYTSLYAQFPIQRSEKEIMNVVKDDTLLRNFIFTFDGSLKHNQSGLVMLSHTDFNEFIRDNKRSLHMTNNLKLVKSELKTVNTLQELVSVFNKYPNMKSVFFPEEDFQSIVDKIKKDQITISISGDGALVYREGKVNRKELEKDKKYRLLQEVRD